MEERGDVMTDNQWDGMIKMFMMMVCDTDTKEEILQKLMLLLRSESDAERVMSKLKTRKTEP